jgi:hypothetical protein
MKIAPARLTCKWARGNGFAGKEIVMREDGRKDRDEGFPTPSREGEIDGPDRPFLAQAQLTYFDKSRRRFIQLSGLAMAGLFLPDALFSHAWAADGSAPVQVNEAVAWAVTGDYAFLAAGHMGLIEVMARRIPLKVLVMDNGCAMVTGGQPVPEGIFEQVLSGWKPYVSRIDDPKDKSAVRNALTRAARSDRSKSLSSGSGPEVTIGHFKMVHCEDKQL